MLWDSNGVRLSSNPFHMGILSGSKPPVPKSRSLTAKNGFRSRGNLWDQMTRRDPDLCVVRPVKGILVLGVGFTYFLCSPLFGEDSHFDEHIFQMG